MAEGYSKHYNMDSRPTVVSTPTGRRLSAWTGHISLWTRRLTAGVAVLLMATACSTDPEFSAWPCRFVYDNGLHLDQTLATATNSMSRGIFCHITESVRQGAKYLVFTNSDGLSSTQRETAAESESHYQLGLSNGIIVGYQTFNTTPNGGFIAYDAQCPNCVRNGNSLGSSKYIIQMDHKGMATCPTCKRQYMLNNRGIVVNGGKDDHKLEQYALVNCTGPTGVVSVFSRQ